MKAAFIHDWLGTYRGGERVLGAMLELYPEAPIYTLFHEKSELPEHLNSKTIHSHKFLGDRFGWRRYMLPFLPSMIESFDLQAYELLLSSSSCVAKGAIPAPGAKHVCYIHSPMRYAWDQRHLYLKGLRKYGAIDFLLEAVLSKSRNWDTASSNRVDQFVANSHFVAERVKRYYGREARVVHPFVADRYLEAAIEPNTHKKDYYICAGALVPYKQIEIAIRACEKIGRKLIVAGGGPEYSRLAKLAGKNTTMIHSPDQAMWSKLIREARALLFPGIEDFGIIPLESIALGTPVVAFEAGGALDYIVPGQNGVFFPEQNEKSLADSIIDFEKLSFEPSDMRATIQKYSKKRFLDEMRVVIKDTLL